MILRFKEARVVQHCHARREDDLSKATPFSMIGASACLQRQRQWFRIEHRLWNHPAGSWYNWGHSGAPNLDQEAFQYIIGYWGKTVIIEI